MSPLVWDSGLQMPAGSQVTAGKGRSCPCSLPSSAAPQPGAGAGARAAEPSRSKWWTLISLPRQQRQDGLSSFPALGHAEGAASVAGRPGLFSLLGSAGFGMGGPGVSPQQSSSGSREGLFLRPPSSAEEVFPARPTSGPWERATPGPGRPVSPAPPE